MSDGETRKVARDIDVGGAIAFRQGEQVVIEAVEPNPERPEYKYVVYSSLMMRRYQLRDEDLDEPQQPQYFAPGDAFQQGVITPVAPGFASPQPPAPGQPFYRPPVVTRPVGGDAGRIMGLSIATGVLGLLVFVGTFLPWISFMGLSGGSGWQAMLHGSTGGFSLVITGTGVVFFTGFWSLAAGTAIMTGAVLLFFRRTLGAWIACIAGGIGAVLAAISIVTLLTNGVSTGVGLWLFLLFSNGAAIVGNLTRRSFS
ncbi:MAG: hypothetical protein ACYC99_03930 [Candidatus Geothermincolia bacterium]